MYQLDLSRVPDIDDRLYVATLLLDADRLSLLINGEFIVRKMRDTGLWMLLNSDGSPVTGGEFDTAREAIDEWRHRDAP